MSADKDRIDKLEAQFRRNEFLQLCNLKQGGMLLKAHRDAAKRHDSHVKDDDKLHGAQELRVAQVENQIGKVATEIAWIKRVGIWVITGLGIQHFFKI